jgi:hypothetical protein
VSAISRVLDRIDRPKQTRPGNWLAGCPCCQSKRGRPISVRELADGRVLVHPFCGCTTVDVVEALGLTLGDLFDKPLAPSSLPPVRGGLSARELLELVSHEAMVAALLTSDAQGRALTQEEQARLGQAAARLNKAREMVSGG